MNYLFKYSGRRFQAPTMTAGAVAGLVLYRLFNVKTPAFRACLRSRRAAWLKHAAGLQSELNEERRTGCRVPVVVTAPDVWKWR